MASIAASCRLSARAAIRQLRESNARGFRTSSAALAAHNFTMPALSPTMTEGNIASWKVKEGDSFSAGDVLLEVETDKAQMDVEAPDDGIMAKITTGDGSKAVAVGTRIAVIADPGDDISSLKIPPEESLKKESKPKAEESPNPEAELEEPSQPKTEATETKSRSKSTSKNQKLTYPHYPSVAVLLHQNDLKSEDIPASGPNGRLLKGDVLAYLNKIPENYPSELSSKMTRLSHLDLSNIKPAAPKDAPKATAPKEEKTPDLTVSIAVPVSLTAVLEVQKRMHESLGITLPHSTFIARAIALANEDLPYSSKIPTADELFASVLGLDKIHTKKTKHGAFSPEIVALPDLGHQLASSKRSKRVQLFDEIIGGRKPVPIVKSKGSAGALGPHNVFSLSVDKEEEKRAKVFLERVKSVLEAEPGRLVL